MTQQQKASKTSTIGLTMWQTSFLLTNLWKIWL